MEFKSVLIPAMKQGICILNQEVNMTRLLAMAIAFSLLMIATTGAAEKGVKGKNVQYKAEGLTMQGYLATDDSIKGKRPGVLVVHEWWGLNEYVRKRADMLAKLGYTALAVDMYGEGKQAKHADDAKKFSSELMNNFDTAKARFIGALDFLKEQPSVDPDRIAAVGYCFGGGVVLNMARQGTDLRGVASFHGNLTAVTPAAPGSVKTKVLVLHGADDKFVTQEQIEAFKKEMKEAGADLRFISYPGAMHGFTNPDADESGKKFNLPLAYNKEADRKSWEELKKFLEEIFK
jgi:dienelactone hydrolase